MTGLWLLLAFYYTVLAGANMDEWEELGPFPTWEACMTDQRFYRTEGTVSLSECYQR